MTRQRWIVLIASLLAGMAACGGETKPLPPPFPSPVTNPNPNPDPNSTQCPSQCPSSCNSEGECVSTARQCPETCPNDCDAFGQCNYELNPDARYRVDLMQVSVTESGSRACSLTGLLGWARYSCDLYAIFRTRSHELRSPVSRESSVIFGGITIPEITLKDLEQSFEIRVMDENYNGGDMMIATCRPDLTIEALEVGSVTMQCGHYGFDGSSTDEYAGSSLAVVSIRLTALDGGAIRRANPAAGDGYGDSGGQGG